MCPWSFNISLVFSINSFVWQSAGFAEHSVVLVFFFFFFFFYGISEGKGRSSYPPFGLLGVAWREISGGDGLYFFKVILAIYSFQYSFS